MRKKRFSAEQIVVLLRRIKVSMSQGKTAPVACRKAGISRVAQNIPHEASVAPVVKQSPGAANRWASIARTRLSSQCSAAR